MATAFIPNIAHHARRRGLHRPDRRQGLSITTPSANSIRFEVRGGDVWSAIDSTNLNRSEIASSQQIVNGTPVHVAYVMNIDPGTANPNA